MNLISDKVCAIVMLLISLVFFSSALSLDTDFDPTNEKFYPVVLAILLITLSILLFIFPSGHKATWPTGKSLYKIICVFFAILVYSLSLHTIGFIIAASALMAICMWLFDAKVKWIAPVSIISSITFYGVFDYLLGLNLPSGLLSFL